MVDQAIDYLVKHQIGSLPIASALLGGALGLMARTMAADAIVAVLEKALLGVRSGTIQTLDRDPF